MSVFIHNGLAVLIKDILNVGVNERLGIFYCIMTHRACDKAVMTDWGHKKREDAIDHFNEITKILEEKGWGK